MGEMVLELRNLRLGKPVTCVYNPLEYAREPFEQYLARYAHSGVTALLVGMNPGPWGMAQTGVPFGEVRAVRDWLGIHGRIGRPRRELPGRPVLGFECHRREVSGARLWGWARKRFGTPQRFFERFFVINYCPLCLFDSAGRNLTPDKLPARMREPLFAICDRALVRLVRHLSPELVIGIGRFAELRLQSALRGTSLQVGHIPHPSPASPQANKNWAGQVDRSMQAMGLLTPSTRARAAVPPARAARSSIRRWAPPARAGR